MAALKYLANLFVLVQFTKSTNINIPLKDHSGQNAVYLLHSWSQCVHAEPNDQSQCVSCSHNFGLFTHAVDDFMSKINGEEGDAFPCEKAGIIADIELMLPEVALEDKNLFPSWLHILSTKVGALAVIRLFLTSASEQ